MTLYQFDLMLQPQLACETLADLVARHDDEPLEYSHEGDDSPAPLTPTMPATRPIYPSGGEHRVLVGLLSDSSELPPLSTR